jgi:pimeloyl-ACP methyl ester carboxylesterase
MRVEGDGEPLLLLNGLTRPLESWRPFTRELSGRTVISFDAPGVGGSRTPLVPMSISMLAALASAVLAEAGHPRADVLGFSYGGTVAQQLASQSPAVVRRLVLAATSCGVGATPGSFEALSSYRMPLDAALWPRPNRVGTLWHYLALNYWSSIPLLGAMTVPTLVVCGTRDRLVPPANSVLLARRIPGARLELLPAGHDLQRTGPAQQLARAVDAFLPAGPPGVDPVG